MVEAEYLGTGGDVRREENQRLNEENGIRKQSYRLGGGLRT